jgi:aromatic ring-opening dioxygenase catalytic subunit (LigB family)
MNPDKKATILYIPHGGGPLPLLSEEGYEHLNPFLREFSATIPEPEAIVVVSAHWEEPVVSITAHKNPPMLYDYCGFPPESYQLEYPAPGRPRLASRIQAMLATGGIEARLDYERGFDHGLFIPLMLMYPAAKIPCIQISLSNSLDAAFHISLGKAIAPLKKENLLILGSGFSFHNMQVFMSKQEDVVDEKNCLFEDWLAETCCDPELELSEREQRLIDWDRAPHARYCHPQEEHLLPLHVCFGLARTSATKVFQNRVSGVITSAYQW